MRARLKAARTAGLVVLATAGHASTAAADEPLSADACATTAEHAADLREAGHLRDAVASFAVCARDACPRIVRDDCRHGLQAINDGGPHLIPKVHDAAGQDVPNAEVLLDDAILPAEARARGVLVDPGTHVLRARQAGAITGERTFVIAAADGLRTVEVTLERRAASSKDERTAGSKVPWIVGGIGLGVLAVGGAIGTWTYLDFRALDRDCGHHCAPSRVDPVHTRGIVADVVMGVGVVTVVAAVVLSLTDHRTAPAPRQTGLAW